MEKSIKNKVIAGVLVFILILANFQVIVTESVAVLASSIEKQTQKTNHKNVDFNAQFMVSNDEKKYNIRENITNSEVYLNIYTEVKDAGYLKSGKVEIKDENENRSNFNLVEIEVPNAIQNIDYSKNEIILNQLNNNEKLDINIPIKAIDEDLFDLSNLSKNTIVTFNGVYVDGKGEEKDIQKEIELKAEWKEEVDVEFEREIIKVLPYDVEDEKGIVVSENIKLGVKDFKLPIKVAEVEIVVPKIENTLPEEVRVENINTNLNVTHEYKDEKLALTLSNDAYENNIVNWSKNLEELEITYIFKNIENTEVQETQSIATLNMECYSSEKTVLNIENTRAINISEKIGNSVEEAIKSKTEVIYKGNMINTEIETEFTVESNIGIAYEKLIETVEVTYNKDSFVIEEEEIEANTYYKKLTLAKENFSKIFGETGELKIYSGDTLLGTINETTPIDEEGNIIFDFVNGDISEIKIQTSKPAYSGILKIEFLKAIGVQSSIEKEQIKNISHLKIETTTLENTKETNIKMENPITKIRLDTNTNILSTVVENRGVEFTVTLDNNNISADLFKNPKIELRLPEKVTDVKINTVELLLEDELIIKNYEYIKDTNSILINLEGMQTKYNLSEAAYGATIIVNTDIVLDKLAANQKDKVELFVENEASTAYESVLEEKGYIKKDINIVAPLGLVVLNSAEGYSDEEETATSIIGNEAVGKIEANAETKIATMKITAINNYDSTINNIRILGRVPFIGNKSLIDGTDLGTTFDALVKAKISSEILSEDKFDVYYSENGEATENLELEENAWTLEIEDLSKIKSYLIVLKDYEMQIGEKIEFKYDVEVPENLELGSSTHGTYMVYYDNKKEDIVFENTSVPTVVELTTGDAPKIEVSINSNLQENEVARSGQIIKYTIKVKNVGEVDSSQVFVISDLPEGVTYAELIYGGNYEEDYYKLYPEKTSVNKLIGDLKIGQEETIEYTVRVNENIDNQKEIKSKVMLSAKNLPEMIESSEVKNIIENGNMLIELKSDIKENEKIKIGDNITYKAIINNISDYDINNVIAEIELPQELTYKNGYINGLNENASYDNNTRQIKWNVGKLAKNGNTEIVLEVVAESSKEAIEVYVKAYGENVQVHKSNTYKINVCKPDITVRQESTIPEGYVSIGDKIEYKIQVTNNGNIDAEDVQIIDFVPNGMKYLETSYEINGTTKTVKIANNNEAKVELNIPANQTVNMSVKVKADDTNTELQATNIVKVMNEGTELEANRITHTIEAKTLGNMQNGEDLIDIVNTYKISGTAWMDKNENGAKDNEEPVLSGITVMLLDKQTGNIAKDASGQELNTTTEGKGNYTFRNLVKGEYIVVFIYDTGKYVITDYKKAEVEESKNSDVANMKINVNGEDRDVAISDTLSIVDGNIYNINIGLKEVRGFDLKLDKYVTKITVKNSKQTKTYNYDNTKMAKLEVDSKVANETTLIIEYKLVVTNEGGIAGYAKKIVDYIPKELKFSSELNSSWYLAEDGNVYNSELASLKINPGESKELVLVLTKQITGENTGLINNNAEISESYNDNGMQDTDSVAGNKQAAEDDMSNADVYIGVKTGSPVTYIGLSIVMMMILAVGAYFINTKILIKE